MSDTATPPRRKQYSAWSVSLVFHGLLALIFASIVFRSVLGGTGTQIVSTISDGPAEAAVAQSAAVSLSDHATASEHNIHTVTTAAAQTDQSVAVPRRVKVGATEAPPVQLASVTDGMEMEVVGAIMTAEDLPDGTLQASSATELDGVAAVLGDDIRHNAQFSDLLVVWLVDQSISMQRQHQLLAEQLDPFFETFDPAGESGHKVLHSVVGFGQTTTEIHAPGKAAGRVVGALKHEVDVDPTGTENVFTGVTQAIYEYREKTRRYRDYRMLCIVLTDESGDDPEGLDVTARLCLKSKCAVSVVGPSAALGSSRGYHQYVDTKRGETFHLPVMRGPDSPDNHRVLIRQFAGRYDTDERGALYDFDSNRNAWEGGPYAFGMASGYPCYPGSAESFDWWTLHRF